MTDCNSVESDESCFTDSDLDEYYYDKDDFEYEYKARLQRGQNKLRKGSTWDLDRNRKKLLKSVVSLPIPQRSIEILSKFCANHQLKEIVSIMKISRRSVTVHARVNIKHELYRNLESSNVVIKVFTRKNSKKVDIERAKNWNLRVHSVHRARQKFPHESRYYDFYSGNHCESLTVLRIDNIVIMKMIGFGKPAMTLAQRIHRNLKDAKDLLTELLSTVKMFIEKSWQFSPGSDANQIFWHKDEWVFVTKDCPDYKLKNKFYGRNVLAILRVFRFFGMKTKEIKNLLKHVYSQTHTLSYYHREMMTYVDEKLENWN